MLMNIKKFLNFKTATLTHPESPGMSVEVTRSWIGRLFKPVGFATLGEVLSSSIKWVDAEKLANIVVTKKEAQAKEDNEFYEQFYRKNVISVLQDAALRKDFSNLSKKALGFDYYNTGMDIYTVNRITCEDLLRACNRNWLQRLFGMR
jgi:hypothetical protein